MAKRAKRQRGTTGLPRLLKKGLVSAGRGLGFPKHSAFSAKYLSQPEPTLLIPNMKPYVASTFNGNLQNSKSGWLR